jgi:hypothetical protein
MAPKPRYSDDQVDKALGLLRGASSAAPITSEEVGKALGLDDFEGNWKARELISEVMRRRKIPVVARTHGKHPGYWIPTSETEVKEYVQELHRRATGDMGRAALVEVLWHEAHPDSGAESQPSLEDY